MSAYFEACAKLGAKPKTVANWLLGDIARLINETNIEFSELKISPEALAAFIALIEKGTISNTAGKKVIEIMFETEKAPDVIVKEEALSRSTTRAHCAKSWKKCLRITKSRSTTTAAARRTRSVS